jgi:hypothetical protein
MLLVQIVETIFAHKLWPIVPGAIVLNAPLLQQVSAMLLPAQVQYMLMDVEGCSCNN